MKVVAYCYSGCGTCKKALQWCEAHKIAVDIRPIRETPPSHKELSAALLQLGNVKKMLSTSGGDYRELKDAIAGMTDEQVIDLMGKRGNLIKRPFLIHSKGYLVGFDELKWASTLL